MHRRAQGGREPLRVTAKTIAPTTSTTTFPEQFEDAGRLLRRSDRYVKLMNGKGIPMTRVNGTVKFFNHARGFGFISPEGGDKDVFVHASALERSGVPALNEGDKVSFVIEDDKRGRGKQAADVQIA
jgi:CspA family cold shock protein